MSETVDRVRDEHLRAGDSPATTAPSGRSRLLGVDAARGVALLGMVAVHALQETDASGRPTWSFTVFGGRASALFALLVGIGIAFLTHRRRVPLSGGGGAAARIGTRALAIGALGLALGYADESLASVILPAYAVMFLLAIPLVFLPTWLVAFVGAVVTAGAPALAHLLLPRLPEPVYGNPSFADLVSDPGGLLIELSLTGEFPAVTWLAYLCAGLVIGRLNLTRMRVIFALLGTGAVLAVAAPVVSHYLLHEQQGWQQIWLTQPMSGLTVAETFELLRVGGDGTTPASTWWWLAVDRPHTGTPLDLLGTTGSAMALLAVMLLAGRVTRPVPRRTISIVLVPLAAAGSMTLTFYTLHIMFINSNLDSFAPMTGYVWQVLVMLLVGTAWWATAGRGPLEALVGGLSRRAAALAVRAARTHTTHAHLSTGRAARNPAAGHGERIAPAHGGGET